MSEGESAGNPPLAEPRPAPRHEPRAWGAPFARFDAAWTSLEARLASAVLLLEIVALCAWISLKGLSAEYDPSVAGERNVSGLVFRGLVGAIVLGLVALRVTRPKVGKDDPTYEAAEKRQNVVVTVAVVLGLVSGRLWANGGTPYFENFLNWLQSASVLMLIGGLRGVATRLTLWLALLGASLATANGKHINIDVVMRFLTPKMRVPVAITGWVAASVMCFAGVWGFFDHIAIALFHVHPMTACEGDAKKMCPTPASAKIGEVLRDMGTDAFVVRRQISLDVRSFPRVIAGTKYNGYLTATGWNTWVSEGDWTSHFPADQVSGLMVPVSPPVSPPQAGVLPGDRPNEFHIPAVSIPGGQEVRGLLIKDADLVFPFGLLMIALRFVLRSLLALSGHVEVDPDSAHREEDELAGHAPASGGPPGGLQPDDELPPLEHKEGEA